MLLRGTIRYMIKCGSPADEYTVQIQAVVNRLLKHVPDVEELFLMVRAYFIGGGGIIARELMIDRVLTL